MTTQTPAYGHNALMTDRTDQTETHDTGEDLEDLEAADPADAPEIAEVLAERLSKELDDTMTPRPPEPGERS